MSHFEKNFESFVKSAPSLFRLIKRDNEQTSNASQLAIFKLVVSSSYRLCICKCTPNAQYKCTPNSQYKCTPNSQYKCTPDAQDNPTYASGGEETKTLSEKNKDCLQPIYNLTLLQIRFNTEMILHNLISFNLFFVLSTKTFQSQVLLD